MPGRTRLAAQKQAILMRELEYIMPGDLMAVGPKGNRPGYKRCIWWREEGRVSFCREGRGISWWWARRVNRYVWIWWEMRKARKR